MKRVHSTYLEVHERSMTKGKKKYIRAKKFKVHYSWSTFLSYNQIKKHNGNKSYHWRLEHWPCNHTMENVTSSKPSEYACAKWYYFKRFFSETNKQGGIGSWRTHEQNEGMVPIKALSFSSMSLFNGYHVAIRQFWWIVINLLGNTH